MFINKYFLTFIYLLIYLKIKTLTVYLNLHVGNICNLSNKCVKNILRYSILELSIFSVYSCGPDLHHWLYWDSLPGGGCQPAVLLQVPPQGQDQPLQDWPFLYCWNSGFHFPPFLVYSLRVGLRDWWKTLHLAKQNIYFRQYEDIVLVVIKFKMFNYVIKITYYIDTVQKWHYSSACIDTESQSYYHKFTNWKYSGGGQNIMIQLYKLLMKLSITLDTLTFQT